MKIFILSENKAEDEYFAEHGLSYFLETEQVSVLFDTGSSDIFIKNAEKMGLDLHKEVDIMALSHGHWDHGDGLQYLKNKTLVAHPSIGMKRSHKWDNSPVGLKLTFDELNKRFTLITTKQPYKISNPITFLGEIPRLNDFESQTTAFVDENGNEDFVPDDSALAIIEDEKLIVVTGCSHAGICNIVEHAKQVTGINYVKAVIGGLHLKHNDRQTQKTIAYLKKQKIEQLYPSHCTQEPALQAIYAEFEKRPVKTGMIINL